MNDGLQDILTKLFTFFYKVLRVGCLVYLVGFIIMTLLFFTAL